MKRRDAFTLTELLVLLPVIAMLGALLLTPLDSAKQTLQAAQCLSNLRQWGLALALYSNDNHDYVTGAGSDTSSIPLDQYFNLVAWFNLLPRYMNLPALKDLYATNQIPAPGSRSVFICPSAPAVSNAPSSAHPYFSYAMNRLMTGELTSCPDNFYKRSTAALPGQVVMFSDSDGVNSWSYSFTDGGFLGQAAPRHNGGDNFVFVDGHAAWESYSVYNDGFPAGTANANSEWITPKQIYWFPCKTCNKTCP
jgi:prepilin-type processing-associated H-X9-DG protein